jgi:hypothetical protein
MVQVALPKEHGVVLSDAVRHLVQVAISQHHHWVLTLLCEFLGECFRGGHSTCAPGSIAIVNHASQRECIVGPAT